MRLSNKPVLVLAILLVLGTAAAVRAAENPPQNQKEEFRAFVAASDIDTLRTVSNTASIVVNRKSTEQELADLVGAFNDRGQEGFLQVLKKLPAVGYFRLRDQIAYDLQFAAQRETPEGGRSLFLVTDRPIMFEEQFNQSRSLDYPFTVIELRLGKNDRGDGFVAPAAKIIVSLDGRWFDVENLGPFPTLLKSVHKVK